MDIKNINLMNDALFKAMMCHENNREMVVDFIHGITGIEKEVLRSGTYIGGEEIPKRKVFNKKQMTDLSIHLENKQRIIIEINQEKDESVFDKNSLYAFSVIVEVSYKNMKNYPKVILINIDNFNVFQTDKPILFFKIRDEDGHIETEMYESIHLVLANINNPKYNIDEEIKKFASFLKERNLEKLAEKFRGDETYMAVIRTVEDLTMDERFIGYYDYEEKKRQDARELEEKREEIRKAEEKLIEKREEIRIAEEKLAEKKKQTVEEMKKAVEEGAKQKAMEMAKKFLSMRVLTDEQIAFGTGLSIEDIKDIKERLKD